MSWNLSLGLHLFAVTALIGIPLFGLLRLRAQLIARNALWKAVRDACLVIDRQGRVADANGPAVHLLGLPAGVIGRPAQEALSEWPELLQLLQTGSPQDCRLAARPGGRTLVARVEPASPTGWMALVLVDRTEETRVEEHLRETERIYVPLIQHLPVGVVLIDHAGRIGFASPRIEEIHDEPPGGLSGRLALDLVHPEDRPHAASRLEVFQRGPVGEEEQEYRLLRKDGSVFWGEIHAVKMPDEPGCPGGSMILTRDITSRKNLELRLKHNLEQQQSLNELLQVLYQPGSLDTACQAALERIGQITGACRVFLGLDGPGGREAVVQIEWRRDGLPPTTPDNALFCYADVPTWQARMASARPVVAARPLVAEDPLPAGLDGLPSAWGTQSVVALPITDAQGGSLGFLGLECQEPRLWSEDELEWIQSVCRVISSRLTQHRMEEDKKHQRELALALQDTASALNSSLNLDEVLDHILTNLVRVVPHDAASIAIVDDQVVRYVRFRGYSIEAQEQIRGARFTLAELKTLTYMAERREPCIIPETARDERWVVWPDFQWIRSYIGVPILDQGRLVGFINLDSARPDFFLPEHAGRLLAFAAQAAIAIENARLYDAARSRAEEMSMLYRIGLTLTAGLEMKQVLRNLLEQCRQVLPIDVFYVAEYNEATFVMEFPLCYERGTFYQLEAADIRELPGLSGEVIRSRRTLYLADVTDPEIVLKYQVIHAGGEVSRSYVGVPLIIRDQVVGLMSMQSYQPGAYTPEQIRLFETIGTQAAVVLENARIFEQMRQMAITDSVTHLFTRRHFTDLGQGEVERALRYHRKLSLLMVDIDHFKRVNDTWGHTVGDQVLHIIAHCCREGLRSSDLIGRWGGEEFAIILPETGLEAAQLIAERICTRVANTEVPVNLGQVRVTVSLGVASLEEQVTSLEILVDCADRALYLAKQCGRNCVRMWT